LKDRLLKQPYFIVVLAHSLHGRLRRIHISQTVLYSVLALALFGAVSLAGMLSSYVRMVLKVSNYNNLRAEVDALKNRYQRLEKESQEKNQQLASLQLFASEVSVAYGIKQRLVGPADITSEGRLVPTLKESIQEYDHLRTVNFTRFYRTAPSFVRPTDTRPGLWPVQGRLLSYFGKRVDPFSGGGAFHTGVDISAAVGTAVHATADGVIRHAEWFGAYGRLIVVDHGNGLSTYYAHLSRFDVLPGQSVRRGDTIAYSGATGRVTSPHVHYEVRMHGTPVNPYPYLSRSVVATAQKRDFPGF